jgi:hypothetical protein
LELHVFNSFDICHNQSFSVSSYNGESKCYAWEKTYTFFHIAELVG